MTAGSTSTTVNLTTLQDTLDETNETFSVTLSSPSANATISDATALITITDDDNPPVVSINAPAATAEGNQITFTVSLTTAS